jgi:hypothetical protein
MSEVTHYLYRIQPTRLEMLTHGPTAEEAEIGTQHFAYLQRLTEEGGVLAGRTLNTDERSFGAVSWNICEVAVCRSAHKVETSLIKVPEFHLPGKKRLHEGSSQFEGIVIDATESPGERPQKNSATTIVARSDAIPRKPSSLSTRPVGRFSILGHARSHDKPNSIAANISNTSSRLSVWSGAERRSRKQRSRGFPLR